MKYYCHKCNKELNMYSRDQTYFVNEHYYFPDGTPREEPEIRYECPECWKDLEK